MPPPVAGHACASCFFHNQQTFHVRLVSSVLFLCKFGREFGDLNCSSTEMTFFSEVRTRRKAPHKFLCTVCAYCSGHDSWLLGGGQGIIHDVSVLGSNAEFLVGVGRLFRAFRYPGLMAGSSMSFQL